ncbi:MAG: hypothetical protein WC464_09430 [Bdellovibrionales bacterium]
MVKNITFPFFLAAGFLIALALSAPEAQAALAGTACSQAGQTKMDTDNKNIIACVCKTTANCGSSDLVWKGMSSGNITCPAGQALTGIVNGQPQCTTMGLINYTCPSGTAATSVVNSVPQCAAKGVVDYSCPEGQYIASISNGKANCFSVPTATCCGTVKYSGCRGTGYMYRCLVNGMANLN